MSAETDTQRCGDPTCRTNSQCTYPDYTLCGHRQGATDGEPGADHDDTEALEALTNLLVHMRWHQQTADRLATAIMASDWPAAYVARKVEAARAAEIHWTEVTYGHDNAQVDGLTADEHNLLSDAVHEAEEGASDLECACYPVYAAAAAIVAKREALLLERAEQAERERDEARRRSSGIALAHAEQCALAEHGQRLAAERRAEVAEQQRDEARALLERATALAEEWEHGPAVGYERNEQVELDTEKEHARDLRAALAPTAESASARPLTLDEHLAEVERRIETEPLLATPGVNTTRAVIRMIHDYREAVRRG